MLTAEERDRLAYGRGVGPQPSKDETGEANCYQATERVDVQHVLLRRARALREEAAGLEDLANALPSGLSTLCPTANDVLVKMFSQAHRFYLG